jgi:hypothetical protein
MNTELEADRTDFSSDREGLPTVSYRRYFVTSGGLFSYGPDLIDQYRLAAGYVDRIARSRPTCRCRRRRNSNS